MKLNFLHKHYYGKDMFYPADENAEIFLDLFDWKGRETKSLSARQMNILKKLDIDISITQEKFTN